MVSALNYAPLIFLLIPIVLVIAMVFYPLFNRRVKQGEVTSLPKRRLFDDYDYIFAVFLIIVIGFSAMGGNPFNGVSVSLAAYFAIRLLYKYLRRQR